MRLFAALSISLFSVTSIAQTGIFQYVSDPGEYVGQGLSGEAVYTPLSALFVSRLNRFGNDGPDYFTFLGRNDDDFLSIQIGTDRLNRPLAVGLYEGAERAPFAGAGKPGLDVSFQSRGSNTLTGKFEILDIAYQNSGPDEWTLERIRFRFEQFAEGGPKALRGTFTYNAVPEPATFAALGVGLLALRSRRERVQPKAK